MSFIFRIMNHFKYLDQDIDNCSIYYANTTYDYLNGYFQLDENEILKLAAWKMTNDYSKEQMYNNVKKINLEEYIPITYLGVYKPSRWMEMLLQTYLFVADMPAKQARQKFMSYLSKNELFQTW